MPANGLSRTVHERFPTALGTDEVPHWVSFRPVTINYGAFGNHDAATANYGNAFTKPTLKSFRTTSTPRTTASIGSGISVNFNNPFTALTNRLEGFVQNVSNMAKINLELPKGLGNINFDFGGDGLQNIISGRLNLGAFNINIGGGGGVTQQPNTTLNQGSLNLYLPPELASAMSANYAQKDLTAAGQFAIDFVGNPLNKENSLDVLKNFATSAINDVVSDALNNVTQRSLGRAKNNYSYAIFNGMQHRTFSYNFDLVAKNQAESKSIKNICDAFMFYMLPAKSTDDFHFYHMPCMWEISYHSSYLNGNQIEYFDKPQNCFLKDVKVTYGTDAFGHTYNDGAPSVVKLSLTFMEIQPMLRNDGDVTIVQSELVNQIGDWMKRDPNGDS